MVTVKRGTGIRSQNECVSGLKVMTHAVRMSKARFSVVPWLSKKYGYQLKELAIHCILLSSDYLQCDFMI